MSDIRNIEDLPKRQAPTGPPVRIEEYQAFYHWLNAKPDSEMKVFRQSKKIKKEDFNTLNDKIVEKLSLSHVISGSTRIIVALSNKKIIEFGSWDKFRTHDFQIAPYSKSISIIWDFYLQLPEYQLPQRHTLKVRFGSTIKPNEFFQLVMQHEEDFEIEEVIANAVVKIDFINPVISSELFNLINEWYDSLQNNFFQRKAYSFLKRQEKKGKYIVEFLFLLAGAFIIATGFNFVNTKFNLFNSTSFKLNYIILFYLLSLVGLYGFYIIGQFWSNRLAFYISKIEAYNIFEVTKGDSNKIEELDKQNRKFANKFLVHFSVTIVVDIIAYIFWEIIKHIK
jgi:hypothetical protein